MSNKHFWLSTIFGGCLIALSMAASKFPADIPRCHPSDTECIKKTTTDLLRKFSKTGYPAAAFPVIEPFFLKRFDISDGRESSLNLKLRFRDVKVSGLSGANIDKFVGFEKDPSKSKFEIYGFFPKITLQGKYVAEGRILILPIQGDGDADITLVSPKFSIKFKPGIQKKNGQTWISVDKLKLLVEPQKLNIKLTNLFNGDPTLGPNLNQFLNENWSDVWNELQPSIHSAIAEIVKNIATPLFNQFSYEDLYLEE